jgi:hypothetical protein
MTLINSLITTGPVVTKELLAEYTFLREREWQMSIRMG